MLSIADSEVCLVSNWRPVGAPELDNDFPTETTSFQSIFSVESDLQQPAVVFLFDLHSAFQSWLCSVVLYVGLIENET